MIGQSKAKLAYKTKGKALICGKDCQKIRFTVVSEKNRRRFLKEFGAIKKQQKNKLDITLDQINNDGKSLYYKYLKCIVGYIREMDIVITVDSLDVFTSGSINLNKSHPYVKHLLAN